MAFTFGPPGTTVGLAKLTRNTKRRRLLAGEETTWEIAQLTRPDGQKGDDKVCNAKVLVLA